jgi:hypothetical protein
MHPARRLGFPLLLLVAGATGLVDAAARMGLIGKNVAAPLILASLLAMTVGVGAASSSHRSLVINTALSAAMVVVAHMALATLARV